MSRPIRGAGLAAVALLLAAGLAEGSASPGTGLAGPTSSTGSAALATALAGDPIAASDLAELGPAPLALRADFLVAARATALPPALLVALAEVESSFDPAAVGPPVAGGPALGLVQFLPGTWARYAWPPGASPFQPGPALLAAARYLLVAGALPGGGWDAGAALYGYNHSASYVAQVLAVAAADGFTPDPGLPTPVPGRDQVPVDPMLGMRVLVGGGLALTTAPGAAVRSTARAEVLAVSPPGQGSSSGWAVLVRDEDGWLASYRWLATVGPGLLPGAVLDPGSVLGSAAVTPAATVGFTLSRAGAGRGASAAWLGALAR
ncbi:MAG: transglycosylase SLT domain-containing protein [Mycobacteriales bacterium]